MYAWLGEGLLPPSSGFTSALLDPDLGGMHGGFRGSRAPSSVLGSSLDLRTGLYPNFCRHKEEKQLPHFCWSWYRSRCGLQATVGASEATPEVLDGSMFYGV